MTAGLLALAPMSPAAADARWCGSACSNKLPSANVTLLDGSVVKCVNSAMTVGGPYHPIAGGTTGAISDPNMTLWHMYSNSCQTTWLRITNSKAIGRTSCYAFERRYVDPIYRTPNYGCPATGTTIDIGMVDDHEGSGGAAAYGYIYETTSIETLARQTDPY